MPALHRYTRGSRPRILFLLSRPFFRLDILRAPHARVCCLRDGSPLLSIEQGVPLVEAPLSLPSVSAMQLPRFLAQLSGLLLAVAVTSVIASAPLCSPSEVRIDVA